VALVTLNRPEVLNALDFALIEELTDALEALDRDEACRAIVLTGAGDRAFAAGADIKELAVQTPTSLTVDDHFHRWERIKRIRKPLIAAVRGFALGGGCELAMTCDMIVAGEDAQFGQPEIKLGVMPGAGGTQRLTRAIGKARAMELVLTGRTMSAREAEAHGLVTSVVASEATVPEALALAARIAAMPPVAVMAAKAAVNRAEELSLEAGLEFERHNFYLLFDTEDQREGMAAFAEKRPPNWKGR
jgi:enoyl-CoA hydratase